MSWPWWHTQTLPNTSIHLLEGYNMPRLNVGNPGLDGRQVLLPPQCVHGPLVHLTIDNHIHSVRLFVLDGHGPVRPGTQSFARSSESFAVMIAFYHIRCCPTLASGGVSQA